MLECACLEFVRPNKALFNLLERLLPYDNSIVKACLTALVGSAHDGFKHLCTIMAKSIPVFCQSLLSEISLWEKYQDVTCMGKMWKFHFRLLAKSGGGHSPMQHSLLFLQSLMELVLSPHITSIQVKFRFILKALMNLQAFNLNCHPTLQSMALYQLLLISPILWVHP